jgi:hypothetical protein
VWHCSVSSQALWTPSSAREDIARDVLSDYGDSNLGEWIEDRPTAFHLRRRLSSAEEETTGCAMDLRGTAEAQKRFERIKWLLPPQAITLAREELMEASHEQAR